MASTGTQLAASISSSSSSPHRRKYDLFLSFRGADTRYEFADTLFTSLKRWGIVVFRDDEGLQRGEEINPALEDAIKKSHYAVVIVSPNYTKSKACMMELTVILECKRKGRLDVFPVFYHIDPSNVGKLTEDFEGYLDTQKNYTEDPKANSEYWKSLLDKLFDGHVDLEEMSGSALKKLSNISAWVVRENSYINPIIDEICQAIWARTINDSPNNSDTLVGIGSRAANVMRLLELEKEDKVRVVGICGMGGIGKTTLAKFIYKRLLPCFESGHFSNPIGKEKDKNYLGFVQKELISNTFPEGVANLSNNAFKVEQVFQTKLRERKVLIVLDDLWDTLQVKQLVGDLKWFGLGSRIIITSRIYDLFHLYKDNNIYGVEELNEVDALKLFCMKAFKQLQPKEGFEELSKKVVVHAKGHPFALDIFGSYLSNKETKARWDGYLKELDTKVEDNIADTLGKSLEELDKGIISPGQVSPLKELFLDIACFFNRHSKKDVLYILEGVEGFGDNLAHNLSVLEEKSLLRILYGQIVLIHDLLVDLSRQIAKSSRLLQHEDIVRVLESPSMETSQVKGIVLELPSKKRRRFHLEVLSEMVNLRVLQIYYTNDFDIYDDEIEEFLKNDDDDDEVEGKMQWCRDFTRIKWIGDFLRFKLSANLRIMEWEYYPLESLPKGSNFVPSKLVILKLCWSRINRLWDGKKHYFTLSAVTCGPTLEPSITDWFIHRSSSSGKEIQIPMDWNSKSKPWMCALLIVYEVYGHDKRQSRKRKLEELENSDIGGRKDNNNICPEFVCQLQLNEASPNYTFVVCVPEPACVGSHGLWLCINYPSSMCMSINDSNFPQELESMGRGSCQVSITASSKNVLLKEGGARLLNLNAHLELVEVVTTISRHGLDSGSLVLSLINYLTVEGPIKPRGPL